MANFYCKHCGSKNTNVKSLTASTCSRSPTKRHELYEGSEKSQYTCKYCGSKNTTLASLTASTCSKSPTKRHSPAL
jgi:ribosomal protein L37E